jgi:hypothetical protein
MGGRLVLVVVFALTVVSCDVSKVDDASDRNVYELTLDYRDGDDFLMAWRSLWQNGAEKCMNDSSLETMRFAIEGVPSPRPVGWQGGALSQSESCQELIDGYPYH